MKKGIKEDTILQDEPLAQKFVKKGFWLYFFTFLIAPASYLIKFILSRQLSPDEYGLFFSVLSFVLLLGVYNDLGLTESLKHFLPRFLLKKKYDELTTSMFTTVFIQLCSSFLIIFLFLHGGIEWFALHHFGDERAAYLLRSFLLFFLCNNIFQILQAVFLSFQNTFFQKFIRFINVRLVVGGIIISFFFFDGSLFSLGWIWSLAMLMTIILGLVIFLYTYYSVFRLGRISFSQQETKPYISYVFWTFLAMNSGMLLAQIDQQMIVNMLGNTASGIYTNYHTTYMLYSVFFTPVLSFLVPVVTELFVKGKRDKMMKLQNFLYTYLTIFSLSFGVFLAIWGPEIAVLLWGNPFLKSGELLYVGGFFVFMNVVTSIGFSILAGIGKMHQRVFILFGSVLINFVFNLLFISYWGLLGVIISTILGQSFMFLSSLYYVNKYSRICVDWSMIIKNIFLLSVASIGFIIVKFFSPWQILSFSSFSLFSFLVIMGSVYGIILLWFNRTQLRHLMKIRKHI